MHQAWTQPSLHRNSVTELPRWAGAVAGRGQCVFSPLPHIRIILPPAVLGGQGSSKLTSGFLPAEPYTPGCSAAKALHSPLRESSLLIPSGDWACFPPLLPLQAPCCFTDHTFMTRPSNSEVLYTNRVVSRCTSGSVLQP